MGLSYAGAFLTVAFSTRIVGGKPPEALRRIPGYPPMESDFDRAGEDAWLVGLAYDFGAAGPPGAERVLQLRAGHRGAGPGDRASAP